MLNLLRVGSKVIIGEDINAIITGINIRDKDYVTYECSWWNNGTNSTGWMLPSEITETKNSSRVKIGFSKD